MPMVLLESKGETKRTEVKPEVVAESEPEGDRESKGIPFPTAIGHS